jgi:hypothetical protein
VRKGDGAELAVALIIVPSVSNGAHFLGFPGFAGFFIFEIFVDGKGVLGFGPNLGV